MKRKPKPDQHLIRMKFISDSINEIADWRHEAVKHATTREQVEAIDRRVYELRERLEGGRFIALRS